MPRLARNLNRIASASLVGLIGLCVAWELWLAPLRPGGSWLVLKALPLLAPLFGILRARRYTHQWASMLSLIYFMEGAIRAMTETATNRLLALAELALSLVFFVATISYARLTRSAPPDAAR